VNSGDSMSSSLGIRNQGQQAEHDRSCGEGEKTPGVLIWSAPQRGSLKGMPAARLYIDMARPIHSGDMSWAVARAPRGSAARRSRRRASPTRPPIGSAPKQEDPATKQADVGDNVDVAATIQA
jgi:hypothetical protein